MHRERQTNIELCRMLAMIMIIGLHYFLYARQDAGSSLARGNCMAFHVLESLCIIGVDLFIMISSWFSVNTSSIKIKKILLLISWVFVWGLIDWSLSVLFYHQDHSVTSLVKAVLPYPWGGKWFVTAYVIYLCFIPFLSKGIAHLSNRSILVLVIIMSLLFSFWPSYLPNPPIDDYGYGFMNFLLIYLIISLFKRIEFIPSLGLSILLFCISFICILIGAEFGHPTCWSYNNPFVLVEAYSVFSIFLQIKVPHSNKINFISSCTFGVFLIHTGAFFSKFVYGDIFKADFVMKNSPTYDLVLNFVTCVFFFYIVCVLLESIRMFISRYINISEKIPNITIN